MGNNKTRVFISFDFDNDRDLKEMLVGQAKNEDSPFAIADWSVKKPEKESEWEDKVRERIKQVEVVAVVCGESTHTATGVGVEVEMAADEGVPYFLLKGRKDKKCMRPTSAKNADKMYKWTWDNLKKLIGGVR